VRLVPEPSLLLAQQSRKALKDQVLPVTARLLELTAEIEEAAALDPQVPTGAVRTQMAKARRQFLSLRVAFEDKDAELALAGERGREPQAQLLLGQFIAGRNLRARQRILDDAHDFVRVETQSPTTVNFVADMLSLTRTLDASLQTKSQALLDLLEGPLAEELRREVEAEDTLRNADQGDE
ncbi:MAG: hypothetical protein AAGK78_15380, partial [Planctomycetota bacterium]